MLEKGKQSDSSQLIPAKWGNILFRYLLRTSDIKKNITGDYEHCMFKLQSAWENSVPNNFAPQKLNSQL